MGFDFVSRVQGRIAFRQSPDQTLRLATPVELCQSLRAHFKNPVEDYQEDKPCPGLKPRL
jgi:hypothetical protein